MYSEESSNISNEFADVPQEPNDLTAAGYSAANPTFKSAGVVKQGIEDDIDSYSSDTSTPVTTKATIIDYKNQFPTNSAGKVSKELLMGDNDGFILARKKKWMTAKKGKTMEKTHQRKWRKFKGKGKGKK